MYKIKYLALLVVAGALSLVAYLGHRIIRIQTIRNEAGRFPTFAFKTLKGDSFNDGMIIPGVDHLVVDHFSPDCEFCQDMAVRIRDGRQLLGNTFVIMVTESDSAQTLDFLNKYGLASQNNILVLLAPPLGFFEKFGTAAIPSFFVYDGDRRLRKRIIGETRIEDFIH